MSEIIHRGLFHRRTKDACHHGRLEKTFAESWEEAQNPPDGINSGVGVLAWLVTATLEKYDFPNRYEDWVPHPERLSQRDAEVAASVVQWLGTNVGFCWLSETLKKCGYEVRRIEPASHDMRGLSRPQQGEAQPPAGGCASNAADLEA